MILLLQRKGLGIKPHRFYAQIADFGRNGEFLCMYFCRIFIKPDFL